MSISIRVITEVPAKKDQINHNQLRQVETEEKKFTVKYKVDTNATCLKFIEPLADLINETKYSISLFYKGAKINVND